MSSDATNLSGREVRILSYIDTHYGATQADLFELFGGEVIKGLFERVYFSPGQEPSSPVRLTPLGNTVLRALRLRYGSLTRNLGADQLTCLRALVLAEGRSSSLYTPNADERVARRRNEGLESLEEKSWVTINHKTGEVSITDAGRTLLCFV